MTPRLDLKSATVGATLGGLFGLLMGGVSCAGIGAAAGVALVALPEKKPAAKTERAAVSVEVAQRRRQLFARGLAASKPEAVEKFAASYRREGALVAARALREHAVQLRRVTAKDVDDAIVAAFEEKLALVREMFGADNAATKSAEANLEAARAAIVSAGGGSDAREVEAATAIGG